MTRTFARVLRHGALLGGVALTIPAWTAPATAAPAAAAPVDTGAVDAGADSRLVGAPTLEQIPDQLDAEQRADHHGVQRQGRQCERSARRGRERHRDVVENEEHAEEAQGRDTRRRTRRRCRNDDSECARVVDHP